MNRTEVIEDLELSIREVGELEGVSLFQKTDSFLLGEVAFLIELFQEAEVAELGLTIRERQAAVGGAIWIHEEDVQVLAVAEGIELNGELPVFVRDEVGDHDGVICEELVGGICGSATGTKGRRTSCTGLQCERSCFGNRLTSKEIAASKVFFA